MSPDLPVSPPAAPVVPVGLGTKLGVLGTTLLAVVALVAAIVDGDHTPETIGALLGAVLTLCTTVGGRMAQAAAALRAGGPVLQSIGSTLQSYDPPAPPRPPGV